MPAGAAPAWRPPRRARFSQSPPGRLRATRAGRPDRGRSATGAHRDRLHRSVMRSGTPSWRGSGLTSLCCSGCCSGGRRRSRGQGRRPAAMILPLVAGRTGNAGRAREGSAAPGSGSGDETAGRPPARAVRPARRRLRAGLVQLLCALGGLGLGLLLPRITLDSTGITRACRGWRFSGISLMAGVRALLQ